MLATPREKASLDALKRIHDVVQDALRKDESKPLSPNEWRLAMNRVSAFVAKAMATKP